MKTNTLTLTAALAVALALITVLVGYSLAQSQGLSEMFSKMANDPGKKLEIKNVPIKYEGLTVQLFSTMPSDSLGRKNCWGETTVTNPVKKGLPTTRKDVKVAEGNTFDKISKFREIIIDVKTAIGGNIFVNSCDEKERMIVLNISNYKNMFEPTRVTVLMPNDINMNNMFVYTGGINVCELEDAVPTYSFSARRAGLTFNAFMPATACKKTEEAAKFMLKTFEKLSL
jgi:hypothetical protein